MDTNSDNIDSLANPTDAIPSLAVAVSLPAQVKIESLLSATNRDDLALRIAVQPGGCSGLRYQLFFDDRVLPNDVVVAYPSFEVKIDHLSLPYLTGAAIDFVDSIEKQGFTIDNPNAAGSCACGDSFH
jgi:iron-sulfur cluster assembly accessory protein